MNQSRVSAIVKKDLMEVKANKMVVVPMVVVPLLLCVLLPGAFTFLALKLDLAMVNGAVLIEKILPVYNIPLKFATNAMKITYSFHSLCWYR